MSADAQATEAAVAGGARRGRRSWRRLRSSTMGMIGLAFVVLFIGIALLAPLLTPYDWATRPGPVHQPPGGDHLLGTDWSGRDMATRLFYGARVSLQVALVATAGSFLVAIPLGLIAGYYRGFLDTVVMRIVDTLLAFPFLILAIMMAAILGPSLRNVVIALAVGSIPSLTRVIRGEVLALREEDYVRGSVANGSSDAVILVRHVLPNLSSTLMVQATIMIPGNILGEATLSFLGVGVPLPRPSWGNMLSDAQDFFYNHPYTAILPGVAIAIATLSFNLLGDAVRDVLDPKARR